MNSTIKYFVLATGFMLPLWQLSPTSAAIFTIDPGQSYLQTSVTFGLDTPQFPGADRAAISGVFEANVDAAAIAFPSGISIAFLDQSSPVEPLPGGLPGSASGNYGLIHEAGGVVGESVIGAIAMRAMVLELAATDGTIFGNWFTSPMVATFSAGHVDINYNLTFGPNPNIYGTAGLASADTFDVGAGGLIQVAGNLTTLTIPLEFWIDVSGFQVNAGSFGNAQFNFQGQIVATALVPEPSSFMLAIVGVGAMVGLFHVRRK